MQIASTRFLRPRLLRTAAAFLSVAIAHMEDGGEGAAVRRGKPEIRIQSIIAHFDFFKKMQKLSIIAICRWHKSNGLLARPFGEKCFNNVLKARSACGPSATKFA